MRPELILTLGGSPLPVVVAALDHHLRLGPDQVSIFHLVFTPEVAPLAARVRSLLTRRGLSPGAEVCIHNHWNVPRLSHSLANASFDWPRCALHYTGGTKLLSAHVRRFWETRGGTPEHASYLSAEGKVWWDDGRSAATSPGVALTLDELAALHFGNPPTPPGDDFLQPKRLAIAKAVHQAVVDSGLDAYLDLLPPLYGTTTEDGWSHPRFSKQTLKLVDYHAGHTSNFTDGAVFANWDWNPLATKMRLTGDLDSVATEIGLSGGGAKRRLRAATWLYGDWLEVWLADHLCQLGLFDEVRQDVVARRIEEGHQVEEFQADVIAIRGYHAVVFSCTVEHRAKLLKQKLFEVLSRATRLCGEHARAALVCMTQDPTEVLALVQELGWEGYDEIRVFGREHVLGRAAPCRLERDGTPGAPRTLAGALEEWLP